MPYVLSDHYFSSTHRVIECCTFPMQAQSLPSTVPPISAGNCGRGRSKCALAPIAPTAFIAEPTNVLVLPFQQLGGQEINAWIGLALQQGTCSRGGQESCPACFGDGEHAPDH